MKVGHLISVTHFYFLCIGQKWDSTKAWNTTCRKGSMCLFVKFKNHWARPIADLHNLLWWVHRPCAKKCTVEIGVLVLI